MIRHVLLVVAASTLIYPASALAQQPAAPLQPPGGAPTAAAAQQPAKTERQAIYDEQADAKQQIAAAVAKAKKENRRVLVQWGANWCGWCHKLHETCAKDKDLSRELLYEYDVVLVDIGRFDKNMDLAASYGADLKGNGVPYLTVLDGEGKATANQETSSLEEGDHHLPAKVLSFLKQHQAEYLTAESVLSDGVKKAAAEEKVVFLHFGAPWCGWCHKLENWMAKPEIAQILGKDFVDVKIDIDRTVGGKDLMKRYAGEKAKGIPWFAFVNAADNTVVATSDDSNGANVGFPAKDEEIAHFGAMLGKAHKSITPEDIQTLLKSLKDANKAAQ